ncbi:galactose-specific lectin nattectin-like [Plectropomus leopardus]|uniref:galactose-specific lectin nattectin-like n=1 Tax=Plectropomus leopardus TaxID=160734 RepID=UPI001C4D0C6B|nr:galactose-specific lectin nattectin-like [Plectropomus leopardus]
MASSLLVIVVLCLTIELWTGVNATCDPDCCEVCPDGWAAFDKKCYQFHMDHKTWGEAEHFCTTIGGNLPSIHSDFEYQVLRAGILRASGAHTNIWVGGYDATHEGIWLWSDGTKFDFNGWGKGEPNNSGGEHCMEMNFNGQDIINDMRCDRKKAFVCVTYPQ